MNVYRTRRFLAPLAFALPILLGAAMPCHAQAIIDTLACGHSDTVNLGSVLAGETIQRTLHLDDRDSTLADSIFVFGNSPGSHFSWKISDSLRLQFNQTGDVPITYSRVDTGWDTTHLILEPSNNSSCQANYTLVAESVGPSANNAVIPLDHTSHNIIAFESDTVETLHIRLQNNTGSSLTFDSLTLDSGKAFRLDLSAVTFPYTLARDSSFPLTLSFIASTPGFYTDFITMPDQPILPLSIQGLLQPRDNVQTPTGAATYIWLYPNPSQGAVTIHTENITNAHVTITDVLGRVERESSFLGNWQWDRQTEGGSFAAAGTYFLIVSGVDGNGKAVHQVERIVLE